MPFISLLGQKSTHGAPVVNSAQSLVTIKGITVNVKGGSVSPHRIHHKSHPTPLTNHMQSYVTIEGKPIFLLGDSAKCGSVLCPTGKPPKGKQNFVQIS